MSQDCAKLILLSFGSNLDIGDQLPQTTILNAFKSLDDLDLTVVRASRLYRTPCFPAGAGPDYVNAAACVAARDGISPPDVLAILHEIEGIFGRARDGRWAGRTLDIDLLAFDHSISPDRETYERWYGLGLCDQLRQTPDQLILPHPRMQDRSFVLVPLADVAPDWVHPVLGLTVREMLALRPAAERAAVLPVEGC